MDLRMALELRAELPGPCVVAATVADRHAAVDRVAKELVAEVVQAPGARRLEDIVVDELLERRVECLGWARP